MTFDNLVTLLEQLAGTLKCDVAYSFFKDEDEIKRQRFLLYELPETDDFYADGVNYANIEAVNLEFYSPEREFATEKQIDAFLKQNEIAYKKNAAYISTEKVHLTTYELEEVFSG